MSDESIEFNNSSVVAGNIGGSGNTAHMYRPTAVTAAETEQITDALQALRAELARLQGELDDAEGQQARPGDVEGVIDLLPEQPEGSVEPAARAWTRLMSRLPVSALNLDSVAKIISLLEQLKGLTGAA